MEFHFHLVGKIFWSVGSCHDDRSESIDEKFNAPNKDVAIEKARSIIQERHKKRSHLTDYSLTAELRIIRPIWKIQFQDEQSARRAVPAQPAHSAVPAHFEEKKLI